MIDLHTHTTASDGWYTPTQLVDMAAEKDIKVLAITDHDTVSGIEEAKNEVKKFPQMKLIPGIEISVDWPTGEFHLLGLGLKQISSSMQDLIAGQKERRENRNKKIVQKMNESGKLENEITLEQLYEKYETKNLGRPHIADFLLEQKVVKTKQKAFDLYLANGRPFYEKKGGCNLDEAIVAIKDCGGVPVIAHPLSLYVAWGKMEETLLGLHERGVEGLEAWHPSTRMSEAERLEQMARKLGFFVTAGSDFHGEQVRKGRRLGHTTKDIKIDDKFYFEELAPHL